MTTAAPTPHDVWFGSAIIARALKDNAREWFDADSQEFRYVCAMTGKSPAAVQALASEIFRRGDTTIVDRLIAASERNAMPPEHPRRDMSAVERGDENQPLSASKVDPVQPYHPKLYAIEVAVHCDVTNLPTAQIVDDTIPDSQDDPEESRLLTPVEKPRLHIKGGKVVAVSYDGSGPLTLQQWADRRGLSHRLLSRRLCGGWTFIEAISAVRRPFKAPIDAQKFEYQGKMYTVPELAKRYGLSKNTIYRRIRGGHSIEACVGEEKAVALRFKYEIDGQRMTASEWCRHLGLNRSTVYARLRTGWPIEKALGFVPMGERYPKFIHNGQARTLTEWSALTGLHKETIRGRIRQGWTIAQAIETAAHQGVKATPPPAGGGQ